MEIQGYFQIQKSQKSFFFRGTTKSTVFEFVFKSEWLNSIYNAPAPSHASATN